MPPALLDSACAGKPALIGGNGLSDFKMFFSNREFRRLGALRIIPLPYKDGETAYLISAETAALAETEPVPAQWPALLTLLAEKLRAFSSRFLPPSAARQGASAADDAKAAFASALGTARGRMLKCLFVIVPLSSLIESVKAKTPQADGYRLFTEACAALSRMFSIPGSVIALPRFRVGILLASQVRPDPGLILHQLSSGLGRCFQDSGSFTVIAERVIDPSSHDFRLDELLQSGREGP